MKLGLRVCIPEKGWEWVYLHSDLNVLMMFEEMVRRQGVKDGVDVEASLIPIRDGEDCEGSEFVATCIKRIPYLGLNKE